MYLRVCTRVHNGNTSYVGDARLDPTEEQSIRQITTLLHTVHHIPRDLHPMGIDIPGIPLVVRGNTLGHYMYYGVAPCTSIW